MTLSPHSLLQRFVLPHRFCEPRPQGTYLLHEKSSSAQAFPASVNLREKAGMNVTSKCERLCVLLSRARTHTCPPRAAPGPAASRSHSCSAVSARMFAVASSCCRAPTCLKETSTHACARTHSCISFVHTRRWRALLPGAVLGERTSVPKKERACGTGSTSLRDRLPRLPRARHDFFVRTSE